MVDTVPGSTGSTATISVGGNVTVVVDTAGDRDWYRVNLVAGTTYYFSTGATGVGDLPDSYLYLRDLAGTTLVGNDDISATNFYSAFSFTATSTGTYFLDAGSSFNDTGNLRLSVNSFVLPADTVLGTTASTTAVAVGGTVNGVINNTTDHDFYRVTLVAGQTYTFSTGATGSNDVGDTQLTLRDGAGTQLATNDDVQTYLYYSSITFTATTSGTYYLDVNGFAPNVGNFQLSVVNSSPPPTDTVPGDTTSTVTVAIGSDLDGSINMAGDHDWYKVTLVAGQTYVFQTSGTGAGDLTDTTLALRNAAGTQLAFNDDSGSGYSALIFTATTSGTYYLDVGAYSATGTGNFNIAAATYTAPPLYTNNQIADQLVNGYWLSNADEAHHFNVTSGGTITFNVSGLTANGQFFAREAFNVWHDATGINFVETAGAAQITVDDTDPDGAYATAVYSGGITTSADVNVSVAWIANDGTNLNSYSFQTFIHEIGHALGLGHAGNYNGNASYVTDALYRNDSWATTIMSYFSQTENFYFSTLGFTQNYVLTPMVADGIGMTTMYGTATGIRTGATVYGFGNTSGRAIYDAVANPLVAYTVFDNGGTDTLNYSGYTQAQKINLNAETFSNVGGGFGNVTIARGTIIENANGGSGADTITGNGVANVLNGNAGNDSIDGGSGNDSITGGLGADTMIGGVGIDTLVYTGSTAGVTVNLATNAVAGGHAAGDVISLFENVTGSALADNLTGSTGDNVILGAAGADTMNGGTGVDTVSYAGSNVAVQVNILANTAAGGHAAGDIISNFENIIGSSFNDTLTGNTLANSIAGGLGNDSISGGTGNDILNGETGNDSLLGGDGLDTLLGGIGADAMDGGLGVDTLSYVGSTAVTVNLTTNTVSGGHATGDTILGFENVLGSAYADNIMGNALANTITGGAGADTLNGSTGLDTLSYEGSNAGVTASLTTNTTSGGHGAGDVISNFENLLGSSLADNFIGSAVANVLTGGSGNDSMDGAAGNDTLRGGIGADQTTGGLGLDTFIWDDGEFGAMTTTGADRIVDFSTAQGDKINLSLVDANTTTTADNAFTFIGAAAFSNVAGQLRYEVQGTNTIVMGDQDGNGAADFWIRLDGVVVPVAGNFVL